MSRSNGAWSCVMYLFTRYAYYLSRDLLGTKNNKYNYNCKPLPRRNTKQNIPSNKATSNLAGMNNHKCKYKSLSWIKTKCSSNRNGEILTYPLFLLQTPDLPLMLLLRVLYGPWAAFWAASGGAEDTERYALQEPRSSLLSKQAILVAKQKAWLFL